MISERSTNIWEKLTSGIQNFKPQMIDHSLAPPMKMWMTHTSLALFPGLHAQLLSLAVRKAGGRPGRIYHVMCAAADVTISLLTSGFVLSPSLFFPWIQFVLSVQFALWVWLLLDQSWLATVRGISSGVHHVINPSRPSPRFSYCKR